MNKTKMTLVPFTKRIKVSQFENHQFRRITIGMFIIGKTSLTDTI